MSHSAPSSHTDAKTTTHHIHTCTHTHAKQTTCIQRDTSRSEKGRQTERLKNLGSEAACLHKYRTSYSICSHIDICTHGLRVSAALSSWACATTLQSYILTHFRHCRRILKCLCVLLVSPFFISKDELAQFEVTQHDARLVAVCHGKGHLTKEPAGVLLIQPPTALHQSVHVPKVLVQEHVGLAFAKDDVPDASHVFVGW